MARLRSAAYSHHPPTARPLTARPPTARSPSDAPSSPDPRDTECAKDSTSRRDQLLRLLRSDTPNGIEETEMDITRNEDGTTLAYARCSAGITSCDPLKVLRAWWWEAATVQDTATVYWPSSAVLDELPTGKLVELDTRVRAMMKQGAQGALKRLAKAMQWERNTVLHMYVLFGEGMCQSRKFMDETRKLVELSGSPAEALRAMKNAQHARLYGQLKRRKVSPSEEWTAYDAELARSTWKEEAEQDKGGVEGARDEDEEEDSISMGNEAGSAQNEDDGDHSSGRVQQHSDSGLIGSLGDTSGLEAASCQNEQSQETRRPPDMRTQHGQSKNPSQLRAGQHLETPTSPTPLDTPLRCTFRAGNRDDVDTSVVERSVEEGRGGHDVLHNDAPSDTEDGQTTLETEDDTAQDMTTGEFDDGPRDQASPAGGPDGFSTSLIHTSTPSTPTAQDIHRALGDGDGDGDGDHSLPSLIHPSVTTTPEPLLFTPHMDMNPRKRGMSEQPDSDRHIKRRQILSTYLEPFASARTPSLGVPDEKLLGNWLAAVSGGKGGGDEDGLRVLRRHVDDASKICLGVRTCVLYTTDGGHTVACAYIDKRSGTWECKIYVADKTAIDVDIIKQALRHEDSDGDKDEDRDDDDDDEQIKELEFTPLVSKNPHFVVVVAATCICMHCPLPESIAAFPPVWSYAINIMSHGPTADGGLDTTDALATVASVLPCTGDVLSATPDPGSVKRGARLTTNSLEMVRQARRQSKLICEALANKILLATFLLADAALLAHLASLALDRLRSGKDQPDSDHDAQLAIASCEASLRAQLKLPKSRYTQAEVSRLEKQLEDLKSGIETPDRRLEMVERHMQRLAGFIAARRTGYEMEKWLYESA